MNKYIFTYDFTASILCSALLITNGKVIEIKIEEWSWEINVESILEDIHCFIWNFNQFDSWRWD